jgi:hypothetical protein
MVVKFVLPNQIVFRDKESNRIEEIFVDLDGQLPGNPGLPITLELEGVDQKLYGRAWDSAFAAVVGVVLNDMFSKLHFEPAPEYEAKVAAAVAARDFPTEKPNKSW